MAFRLTIELFIFLKRKVTHYISMDIRQNLYSKKIKSEFKRLTGRSPYYLPRMTKTAMLAELDRLDLTQMRYGVKDFQVSFRPEYLKSRKGDRKKIRDIADKYFKPRRVLHKTLKKTLGRMSEIRKDMKDAQDLGDYKEADKLMKLERKFRKKQVSMINDIDQYGEDIDKVLHEVKDNRLITKMIAKQRGEFARVFAKGNLARSIRYVISAREYLVFTDLYRFVSRKLSKMLEKVPAKVAYNVTLFPMKEDIAFNTRLQRNVVYSPENGFVYNVNPGTLNDVLWFMSRGRITDIDGVESDHYIDIESELIGEIVLDVIDYRRSPEADYFNFVNRTPFDLSDYQIYKQYRNSNDENHCLVHSLGQAGVDKSTLEIIRFAIADEHGGDSYPTGKLRRIARIIGKNINLTKKYPNGEIKPRLYGDVKTDEVVQLGFVEDHYICNNKTKVTRFTAKHWRWMQYQHSLKFAQHRDFTAEPEGKLVRRKKTQKLNAINLISMLLNDSYHERKQKKPDGKIVSHRFFGPNRPAFTEIKYHYTDVRAKTLEFPDEITAKEVCKYKYKSPFGVDKKIQVRKPKPLKKMTIGERAAEMKARVDDRLKRQIRPTHHVFADFEAFVQAEHQAFEISFSQIDDKLFDKGLDSIMQIPIKTIFGLDCACRFLDQVPNRSIVWFHNLSYDSSLILKHVRVIGSVVQSSAYQFKVIYHNKVIIFRDSLKIIPMALKQFPATFMSKKERMKHKYVKEVMPYGAYSAKYLSDPQMLVSYALSHIFNAKKKAKFLKNLEDMNLLRESEKGTTFDCKRYAQFYCERDVRIQMIGMMRFRCDIRKHLKFDIFEQITISSASTRYGLMQGVYDGCFKVSGNTMQWLQRAVVGGRVMCRNNKKQHFVGEKDAKGKPTLSLSDYDCCSLYPSAMYFMCVQYGFPKGKPKKIPYAQIRSGTVKCLEWLNKQTYYYVEINVTKLNKRLNFSTSSRMIEDSGTRRFSNDPVNKVVIGKIGLEDLVEFQNAEFEIITGMYFDQGFNTEVGKLMRTLYDKRRALKKVGNLAQQLFKLIMNTFYGKTIMKAQSVQTQFLSRDKMHKYIARNASRVIEARQYGKDQYLIKERVPAFDHSNFAHIGAMVLEYSKRIMNRVICLAEELNITVFYTDTDSLQIEKGKLGLLSEAFEKKYGTVLTGNDMGQFHGDFSLTFERPRAVAEEKGLKLDKSDDGESEIAICAIPAEEIYAIEAYFVGKKCYMCKLEAFYDGELHTGHHVRMKGVNKEGLKYECERVESEHKGVDGMLAIYKKLYEGGTIYFDLLAGGEKTIFSKNKIGMFTNCKKFIRSISFLSDEAKRIRADVIKSCKKSNVAKRVAWFEFLYTGVLPEQKLRPDPIIEDDKSTSKDLKERSLVSQYVEFKAMSDLYDHKMKLREAGLTIPFSRFKGCLIEDIIIAHRQGDEPIVGHLRWLLRSCQDKRKSKVDHTNFIKELQKQLKKHFPINTSRLYDEIEITDSEDSDFDHSDSDDCLSDSEDEE